MVRRVFHCVTVTMALTCGAGALADEVHLLNGLVIEGDTVESEGAILQLKTPSGLLRIPRGVIARVVPGPTRWTRYARERARRPASAHRHMELANWCRQNGLAHRSGEHVLKALQMDPTLPQALEAGGYLPVGDVWMRGLSQPTASGPTLAPAQRERHRKIMDQLVQGWRLRTRSIREAFLKSSTVRDGQRAGFEEGRRRILELSAPLALPAICIVLSDHNTRSRRLLAEVLVRSESDTAALNLVALALLDDEETVRAEAAAGLAEGKDTRVSAALRLALTCRLDAVVRRAAEALGTLRDRSAVADLIDALNGDPKSQSGPDISRLFELIAAQLDRPIEVPLGELGATYPSQVAVVWLDRAASRRPTKTQNRRGALRTEVQEALIAITGQNYGFDTQAWKIWLRQNPPLPPIG